MGGFWANVNEFFRDRIGSPLIRTFVLTWIIVNYRFFLVILSGDSYEYKIDYLSSELYSDWLTDVFFKGFALPTVITGALIYWFPFFDRRVYEKWLSNQLALKKIKTRVEDLTPVPEDVAFQLQGRNAELAQELSEARDAIALLKQRIAALDTPITTTRAQSESPALMDRLPDYLTNPPDVSNHNPSFDGPAITTVELEEPIDALFNDPSNGPVVQSILTAFVVAYPKGISYSALDSLRKRSEVSTLRFDHVFHALRRNGFIADDEDFPFVLTEKGIEFCISVGYA